MGGGEGGELMFGFANYLTFLFIINLVSVFISFSSLVLEVFIKFHFYP